MPTYAATQHSFELPPSPGLYNEGRAIAADVKRESGYPIFAVIDRATFNRLKEAGLKNEDLLKMSSYSDLKNVSKLTQNYLLLLNNVFYRWFHGYEVFAANLGENLTPTEVTYIKGLVDKVMFEPDGELPEGKTSYEIQQADDQGVLIVVENGFLHHLTQSKDASKAFILALLRCIDHFGTTSVGLNVFYLKLTMIPDFLRVVRTRASL